MKPLLVADNPEISLGNIVLGQDVPEFIYRVTNISDQTLPLSLTFGCGSCTSGSVDKPVLASGETTSVRVKFKPNSKGLNVKSVKINYKRSERPDVWDLLQLKFTANVV